MSDQTVERGLRMTDRHGEFRVMAVSEGYAMCRRKGCFPFVIAIKAIERQLATVETLRARVDALEADRAKKRARPVQPDTERSGT